MTRQKERPHNPVRDQRPENKTSGGNYSYQNNTNSSGCQSLKPTRELAELSLIENTQDFAALRVQQAGRRPFGITFIPDHPVTSPAANLFVIAGYGKNTGHTVQESKQLFREYLNDNPDLVAEACETLTGHELACWCPLIQPCHANIWLEILQDTEEVK